MNPNVTVAVIAIMAHGTSGGAGQIIEFSDGTTVNLGAWSIIIIIIIIIRQK